MKISKSRQIYNNYEITFNAEKDEIENKVNINDEVNKDVVNNSNSNDNSQIAFTQNSNKNVNVNVNIISYENYYSNYDSNINNNNIINNEDELKNFILFLEAKNRNINKDHDDE